EVFARGDNLRALGDTEDRRALRREGGSDRLIQTFDDRHDGDYSRDADDDTDQRQPRAQLVGAQARKRHVKGFPESGESNATRRCGDAATQRNSRRFNLAVSPRLRVSVSSHFNRSSFSIIPSRIEITRCARAAMSASCVTTIIVLPSA